MKLLIALLAWHMSQDNEPVLVKPNVEVTPAVWFEMVEGVKGFEGFRPEPYLCPAGKLTIGYGHTGEFVKVNRLDRHRAHNILLNELEKERDKVLRIVKVELTEGQLAALTSFCFNCGENNLRKLVNGPGRLNSGNYDSVKEILPQYRKGGGKVLPGLVKRRSWEISLWNSENPFFVVDNN